MIEYTIDKRQEIIFVNIKESVLLVEVMTHVSNILNDPDFSAKYDSLITIENNVIVPRIPQEKIPIIQEVINGYAQRRKGTKWAVVVSNEITHAIVKTSLDLIGPLSANIRLFRDTSDAMAWIKD